MQTALEVGQAGTRSPFGPATSVVAQRLLQALVKFDV